MYLLRQIHVTIVMNLGKNFDISMLQLKLIHVVNTGKSILTNSRKNLDKSIEQPGEIQQIEQNSRSVIDGLTRGRTRQVPNTIL